MAAVAQISARQLLLLDLKLENVNNWAASGAVNLASDTTYATAGAVKKAYDLAAAALPAGANAVSATKLLTARTISTTGDATGSASFDGTANAAIALTLANSGVTAGTYGKVTVDAKGRVTAGMALVAADIPSLDWSKITSGKPTTLAGYGITDALGINANAVSATKLATARTLTVGGAGKAFDGTANLSWSLAEIGALPAAGGGIAGDFWRAAGDSQFGLVDHLGSSTDAKACLVLLAKKYVGTQLNKTGFVGRILFSRSSVGLLNYTDFVDVSVATAYSTNSVRLQRRSGVTVAAAKIVEVTYNSEVYFALYRPVASDGEVVATGHAFNAALPLLIPDATAYTITDVVTDEEDYHVGNKPTSSDVGLGRVDDARQTRAEYLYGYWGLVPADGNASGWIRTPSQGLLPYQSGGASSLGSSSWQFLSAYVNTIYEGGTSLAAKYLGIGANAVSATKLLTARTISTTGDATGSASFDGTANAAIALTLANSGVTAGTYGKVTVDAKGRVTAGMDLVAADIPSLDWSKITTGKPTTIAGYGITDAAPLSHVGATGAAHGAATASVAGFMSAADKAKLDGIAASANNYSHPTGDGNLHVPATGTTNNAKFLRAGATAGSLSWAILVAADIPSLDWSKITTGKPTTLAGYGITDALGINANAVSASKLATARTITFTGDSTGSVSFDGTADVTINLVGKASGVAAGTYRSVTVDAMGYVTAGTNPTTLAGYGITDALGINANAVSASKWAAARTITLAGDATGSVSIDGSGNVTLTVAVVDNSHTHTAATITDLNAQNEGAVGSTLALRDSAADIHARLLRATYQDQSEMSGALAFRANNSTDNYTRYCSNPTAVRTWLNQHRTSWNMGFRAYIEDPNNPMTEYDIPGKHAVITYLATDGHFRISSSNGAGRAAGERLRIDPGGNLYAAGGVHDMGQRVYSPNNPPHNSHNHTAAQGNSDIVAGSYGQVGTYALASNVTGVTKTIGTTVPGSSLVPASAGDRHQDGTTLPGTWKCLGYSYGTGGLFDSRITLWIRIA